MCGLGTYALAENIINKKNEKGITNSMRPPAPQEDKDSAFGGWINCLENKTRGKKKAGAHC